jgi:hypothetical protein
LRIRRASFLVCPLARASASAKQRLYTGVVRDAPYPVQVVWGADDPGLKLSVYGEQARQATAVDTVHTVWAKHFLQEDQAPRDRRANRRAGEVWNTTSTVAIATSAASRRGSDRSSSARAFGQTRSSHNRSRSSSAGLSRKDARSAVATCSSGKGWRTLVEGMGCAALRRQRTTMRSAPALASAAQCRAKPCEGRSRTSRSVVRLARPLISLPCRSCRPPSLLAGVVVAPCRGPGCALPLRGARKRL